MLGSPIAHSLSAAQHRTAYAELGLPWRYDTVHCTAGQLPALLDGLGPEWAGLLLTMPLKTAVLPLLDRVDPAADRIGAVNTIVLRDGQRSLHNTDVEGMRVALAELVPNVPPKVVLRLGASARHRRRATGHVARG